MGNKESPCCVKLEIYDRKNSTSTISCKMVSENRHDDYGLNTGVRPGCKIVHWQSDWNKFKRLFKATGQQNGIADALRYGEYLANGTKDENVKVEDKNHLEDLERRATE